jgi:cyclophilin family peptidyl-prolyl cis-trans isomerase/HEAT repeat protein
MFVLLAALGARAENMVAAVVSAELGRRYDDALFRNAATDKSPLVRVAAARAAGRIRDVRALAWLLPLMRDDEGRVRRASLFALGQIGSPDVVIPLRAALGELSDNDLAVAVEALGKTNDPRAVPTTTALLTHESAAVRQAAALALFRLADASAVAELIGALQTEREPESRWRQVYAISRLLRAKAAQAKTLVAGQPEWTAPLRAATGDDRPFFERTYAARALGALEGQSEFLLALTADPDPRVVVSAVRALATSPQARQEDALVALVAREDDMVRESVVDALERWGDQVTATWKSALPSLTGRLRLRALVALAAAGEPVAADGGFAREPDRAELDEEYAWSVVPYLPAGQERPDPAKLKTIAGMHAALASCGNEKVPLPWALDVIRTLIAVDDFTVQAVAVGTLAERGAKSEVPLIVRTARNASGPEWMDVPMVAAGALARLGVYDPWLDEAARDPNRFVLDAAREALTKLERPLPPERPLGGFELRGHDTASVLRAAEELQGARVRFHTSRGVMTMVLLPDEAPAHCVNLAQLVTSGFYDNKRWHRFVPNFVIQGGCPRGDGWGGPGYTVPDEIGTRPYVRGTVGMPKAGDDTGGCQLFITHLPTPHLDGRYTVFAQVIEGFDVIDRIRIGDRIEKATLEVREKIER